ncbi:uncharacterized protein LOC127697080 [Apodemus sylvaticus]|uniref:uncharacterized protein LOC127697080 n=1 Tax=Apodemus sylvaticus TaxID=10129 RepID=UPI0022425814|nr:uncharacterized protein LOC127697080 [Apodemus sylvaticus]
MNAGKRKWEELRDELALTTALENKTTRPATGLLLCTSTFHPRCLGSRHHVSQNLLGTNTERTRRWSERLGLGTRPLGSGRTPRPCSRKACLTSLLNNAEEAWGTGPDSTGRGTHFGPQHPPASLQAPRSLQQVSRVGFLLSTDHTHPPPHPTPPRYFGSSSPAHRPSGLEESARTSGAAEASGARDPAGLGLFRRVPPQTGRTRGGARAERV